MCPSSAATLPEDVRGLRSHASSGGLSVAVLDPGCTAWAWRLSLLAACRVRAAGRFPHSAARIGALLLIEDQFECGLPISLGQRGVAAPHITRIRPIGGSPPVMGSGAGSVAALCWLCAARGGLGQVHLMQS
jgi:hypothetical protein